MVVQICIPWSCMHDRMNLYISRLYNFVRTYKLLILGSCLLLLPRFRHVVPMIERKNYTSGLGGTSMRGTLINSIGYGIL